MFIIYLGLLRINICTSSNSKIATLRSIGFTPIIQMEKETEFCDFLSGIRNIKKILILIQKNLIRIILS